ncbi:MAG: outer membrane protein assembly factor BamE [Porticoccaceae bacterium]|nr:outer membrane protein assembly factor BamE [Porticoccaceae bacterium]
MARCAKLSLFALLLITIAGCKNFAFPGVHKIEIEQGNIITQEMVDQLQPGMTREQVRFVLGTPLVADTFNSNRWDYLYSLDKRKGNKETSRLSVFFDGNSLVRFSGDFAPTPKTLDDASSQQEVE